MIGGERTELMDALARPLKTAQSARVISRRFQRIVWAWIASAALMNLQAAADTNVQSASPGLTRSPAALLPLDRLAAAFSPRLRALATERDELVEQLAGIPTPNSAPTSATLRARAALRSPPVARTSRPAKTGTQIERLSRCDVVCIVVLLSGP